MLAATRTVPRSPALNRAVVDLQQAVAKAGRLAGDPPRAEVVRVQRAHQQVLAALRAAGAPRARIKGLDRQFHGFVAWWRRSGPTACAAAVDLLEHLSGAAGPPIGKVLCGADKTDVRQTAWYPELARTPGAPARPRLYKNRRVSYEVRYQATRLGQVATAIMARIDAGHVAHARVLTGYLHADAGSGMPPRASHSLAITGYQVLRRVGGQPDRVAFECLDPDGGHKLTLVLDVTALTFQHVPTTQGWVDRGSYGWDYGVAMPPIGTRCWRFAERLSDRSPSKRRHQATPPPTCTEKVPPGKWRPGAA